MSDYIFRSSKPPVDLEDLRKIAAAERQTIDKLCPRPWKVIEHHDELIIVDANGVIVLQSSEWMITDLQRLEDGIWKHPVEEVLQYIVDSVNKNVL